MPITFCVRVATIVLAAALAACSSGGGDDDSPAQVRLLNVSPGYESLDLYVDDDNDDDDGKTRTLEAVGYEAVSEYAQVDSGTYTLEFRRNGVSGALKTVSAQNLPDEARVTYVAYGSSGRFAVQSIDEDIDEPDAGDTYVRVLNAAEAVGSLNVYFTEESVSLDNVSPDFASIGSGTARLDSGTYRLRVTGADDSDDVRLDVPEVTLESGKVVSLIFTSTQGGVLVNALLLPQTGDLTMLRNTKARIRGAVGISSGAMTTMRVGGATLFSNATAGAIGSNYVQVDAGAVAITMTVDGTPVSTPSQTLAAGGDYTLLAWNDAAGVQTTLISDDNRLPAASGNAKLRLINGMSGFGDPLTLAVDYSPVAEAVVLGAASEFAEIDSGTDYLLDVSSALTAAPVLSKSSVTLQTGSVYTMFLAGSLGDDEVSAILRKDR